MRAAVRLAAIALAASATTGCATMSRFSGTAEARAFLLAVRDNDQAAFDAVVDKRSVIASHRRMFPQSTLSDEALTTPVTYRRLAAAYRFVPGRRAPDVVALGANIQSRHYGFVCLKRGRRGDCEVDFAQIGRDWRMIRVANPALLEAR